jgi:hypothetical protein
VKEIYLSCSEKDRRSEDRLRDGLSPVLPQLGYTLWGQRDLMPGTKWKDEMKRHLASSQFFIPLVTPSYLASDMCNKEMLAACYRAEHEDLKIISIRIRPCMFEYSRLAAYDFLPKDGRTIAEYKKQDAAWTEVLRDLLEAIRRSHRYLR